MTKNHMRGETERPVERERKRPRGEAQTQTEGQLQHLLTDSTISSISWSLTLDVKHDAKLEPSSCLDVKNDAKLEPSSCCKQPSCRRVVRPCWCEIAGLRTEERSRSFCCKNFPCGYQLRNIVKLCQSHRCASACHELEVDGATDDGGTGSTHD